MENPGLNKYLHTTCKVYLLKKIPSDLRLVQRSRIYCDSKLSRENISSEYVGCQEENCFYEKRPIQLREVRIESHLVDFISQIF